MSSDGSAYTPYWETFVQTIIQLQVRARIQKWKALESSSPRDFGHDTQECIHKIVLWKVGATDSPEASEEQFNSMLGVYKRSGSKTPSSWADVHSD